MKMTPQMIPSVVWVSCQDGLPTPGTFVWIVVGKIIEGGLARRYPREVHMGVLTEGQQFQIHPYHLPLLSTQIWAWARMIPPEPPLCKSTELRKDKQGEEWKDIDADGNQWNETNGDDDDETIR